VRKGRGNRCLLSSKFSVKSRFFPAIQQEKGWKLSVISVPSSGKMSESPPFSAIQQGPVYARLKSPPKTAFFAALEGVSI